MPDIHQPSDLTEIRRRATTTCVRPHVEIRDLTTLRISTASESSDAASQLYNRYIRSVTSPLVISTAVAINGYGNGTDIQDGYRFLG
jgi:hypothetical protein